MTPPKNKKGSSSESSNAPESLGRSLLNDKVVKILLGIGLLLVLCNIAIAFGLGATPNAWLFHINMHYWSVYTSVVLWAIAIWVITASIESLEDYMPTISIFVVACILLAVIFALRSSAHTDFTWYTLFFNLFIVATVCCVVRSLFLFYDYWYNDGTSIDTEETQWFLGMSGILVAVFSIVGMMSIIVLQVPTYEGSGSFASMSLYHIYRDGMFVFLRTGQGPTGIQVVAFLMFVVSIAFVYVAGMWTLVMLHKFREGE